MHDNISVKVHADHCVKSYTLYVTLGSSHLSLKVLLASHVPRDPAITYPAVFKGPANLLYWSGLKCPIVMLGLIL